MRPSRVQRERREKSPFARKLGGCPLRRAQPRPRPHHCCLLPRRRSGVRGSGVRAASMSSSRSFVEDTAAGAAATGTEPDRGVLRAAALRVAVSRRPCAATSYSSSPLGVRTRESLAAAASAHAATAAVVAAQSFPPSSLSLLLEPPASHLGAKPRRLARHGRELVAEPLAHGARRGAPIRVARSAKCAPSRGARRACLHHAGDRCFLTRLSPRDPTQPQTPWQHRVRECPRDEPTMIRQEFDTTGRCAQRDVDHFGRRDDLGG